MTSQQSGTGGGHSAIHNFFLVHLQSLTDFARELTSQVGAIRTPTQSISGLSTHPMPLGDFAEGHSLHAQHQVTAKAIHGLLESARGAIEFAGDVTDVIASSYQRFDDHVADLYYGNATTATTEAHPGHGGGHGHGHGGGHGHGHGGGHGHGHGGGSPAGNPGQPGGPNGEDG